MTPFSSPPEHDEIVWTCLECGYQSGDLDEQREHAVMAACDAAVARP